MALDQDQRSVKVVFNDYQSETGPCGQSPAEIKALLLLAVKLVQKRCSELGHKDYPCEQIFFKPLRAPANDVTAGEPVNVSPGNNHTTWYDELDLALGEVAQQTSGSYAYPLNNPIRSLQHKEKHKWCSWAELDSSNPATEADCATLTPEAMDKLVNTCCRHIGAFTTVWG